MVSADVTVRQRMAALVPTRLRWWLAYRIDNGRRDVCWSDLVDYALWDKEHRTDDPEGEPTLKAILDGKAARCKSDPTGGCYCGKYVLGARREKPGATP